MPDLPPDHPPGDPSDADPDAGPPLSPSLKPRYEDDPPTSHRRGLPTWAWVILVIVMVIVGLPLLALGALYLFCLFTGPMRLH